jgi:hypothetical protein
MEGFRMTTTVNSMRALAVGLALTFTIGALAGCSNEPTTTTTRTVTTDTTAPVAPPAATTTTTERTTTTNP